MTETSSTILRDAAVTNQTNKKIKFIIGGLIIAGLITYLIASSISSAGRITARWARCWISRRCW